MAYEDYCCPIIGDFYITSNYSLSRTQTATQRGVTTTVTRPHQGIDMNDNTRNGTIPIHAVCKGKVKYINKTGRGQPGFYISIWHENDGCVPGMPASESRFFTNYFHILPGTLANLNVGDTVEKGQQLGIVGRSGRTNGPHLHFEIVKENGQHIDPREFINTYSEDIGIRNSANGRKRYRRGINPQPTSEQPNINQEQQPVQGTTQPETQQSTQKPVQSSTARSTPEKEAAPSKSPEEKKKEDKKEKEIVPLTEDEIRASAIGFYLPQLIQERKKNDNDSIIHLDTDLTTSYIQNLIFSKSYKKDSDFSLLSNLDLSSLVPYVELYSLKKGSGGSQKHILYPFDDYSSQLKLDLIFADKTGRGGNIGIESVDWESVATNPSNVNQIMVTVKVRIQDIQDIETSRNGISLLDFLYPGGSSNNTEFRARNFNVKIKAGWLYKRQQNNTDFTDLDKKLGEKLLSESILATLHKHSFDFESDGSVLLELKYYGMLETELSDPYEFDVLEKLNPKTIKARKRKSAADYLLNAIKGNWTKSTFQFIKEDPDKFSSIGIRARTVPENPSTSDQVTNYIDYGGKSIQIGTAKYNVANGVWDQSLETGVVSTSFWGDSDLVDYIQTFEDTTEEELEEAYLDGIANLLQTLSLENRVYYLNINKEQIEILKNLSEISQKDEILSYSQYESFIEKIKKLRLEETTGNGNLAGVPERTKELLNTQDVGFFESAVDWIAEASNTIEKGAKGLVGIEVADRDLFETNIQGDALKRDGNKLTISAEEYEKAILRDVSNPGEIAVSYVFLGDILNYYMKLFFDEKEVIANKDLRLVLGTFSYRDIGQLTSESIAKGNGVARTSKVLATKNGALYKKVSAIKKYANFSDIPISMESLINWYNTNVLDSSIERMSFNKFIRSLFNNIVPANLANGILNYGPKRTIIPGVNYITTYAGADAKTEEELRNSAANRKEGEPKYQINMNYSNYRNSSFFRLRNKAEIKGIDKKYIPVANYVFITSLSESDKNLLSSYERDYERGIYHFYVGEDKGLVKEIKFTKEDNPKLDAANLVKANKNSTDNMIIRQVYNCNINLIGNTVFYPGQLVYVNPTYPGTRLKNKTLFKIGLGGYFQIIKIKNFIESGKFETKIETKWLTDGQGLSGIEGFIKVQASRESDVKNNAPNVIGAKK